MSNKKMSFKTFLKLTIDSVCLIKTGKSFHENGAKTLKSRHP